MFTIMIRKIRIFDHPIRPPFPTLFRWDRPPTPFIVSVKDHVARRIRGKRLMIRRFLRQCRINVSVTRPYVCLTNSFRPI